MSDEDRKAREERVVEAVRQWLPELTTPGSVIQVTACEPGENDGALFTVTKTRAHICRR